MAIAPANGTLFNQAVAVASFTVPYVPVAGNGLVIAVLLNGPAVSSLVDNLGNTYTPDATFGSSAVYHISSAAAGITGFTVTEASGTHTGTVAIEEYSGQTAIAFLGGAGGTTSQTGKSGNDNGDYLVAVAISGAAIASITNATSRQNGGNNGDFIEIGDAGPESPNTSVTFSYSASVFSGMWLWLVGGPGKVRQDQDVILVAKQTTSANARFDQDLILSANKVTSAKARFDQDLILLAAKPTSANAHFGQDVILVAGRSARIALWAQDVILVAIQNPLNISSFLLHFISPIHPKRRIGARHIQRSYLLQAAKKKFPFLFVAT